MPPKKTKSEKVQWTYNNQVVTKPLEGHEGFIYIVYNDTKDMFYIGRKSFYSYSKKN